MANPGLTSDQMQEAVNAVDACGNIADAAKLLNIHYETLRNRLKRAEEAGITPTDGNATPDEILKLKEENRTLRTALNSSRQMELNNATIRETIFKAIDHTYDPPRWLTPKKEKHGVIGVPTVFWSDWHWGERVNPSEIGNVNEFDGEIAADRVSRATENAINVLFNHLNEPDFPGLILALGGDMVTGTIHDELVATNDMPMMPTVLDLFDRLVSAIERFLEVFPYIFVPCVAGNHGRLNRKPNAKERAFTNWDWLVYRLLSRHFSGDDRVKFYIPDGPDALFSVYDHRYLLTHGDQFRGGDGIIGPLGPITRGRHKKASRNSAIDMEFDTMIIGHFHTLMQLPHLIVNGSLKGYDEYAFQNNFGFERAAQAMWITHPVHGITFQMPIYVQDKTHHENKEWVSWQAA